MQNRHEMKANEPKWWDTILAVGYGLLGGGEKAKAGRLAATAAPLSVSLRRELPEKSLRQYDLLIKFFVASETFFFLALIITYVYYRNLNEVISTSDQILSVKTTGLYTVLLVASSATLWWGRRELSKEKPLRLAFGLFITLVLGIAFLYGQGQEYTHLLREDVTVDRNIFGSAFFTLTGFHALHVFVGLLMLSIVLTLTLMGDFTGPHSAAVAATELYWHFVDVVWLVVFTVMYIIPIL